MHLFYLACQALLLGQHAHSHQNIYDKYLLLLCNCLEVYHKQFQNNSFDRIVTRRIIKNSAFVHCVTVIYKNLHAYSIDADTIS